MPEFAVLVQTTATPDFTDTDLLDGLVEAFTPVHGAVSQDDGRLSAQVTVTADDMAGAVRAAERATLDGLGAVGIVLPDGGIESVQITTQAAFDRWLDTPPDLVSTAEAAGLLGVSRQRVRALALEHPQFPAPIKVGRELAFPGRAVRRFADLVRVPGRHAGAVDTTKEAAR